MTDKGYTPPYTITDEILNLVSDITEILTKLTIDDKTVDISGDWPSISMRDLILKYVPVFL